MTSEVTERKVFRERPKLIFPIPGHMQQGSREVSDLSSSSPKMPGSSTPSTDVFTISSMSKILRVEDFIPKSPLIIHLNKLRTWKQKSIESNPKGKISPRSIKPRGFTKRFANLMKSLVLTTPCNYHRRSESIARQLLEVTSFRSFISDAIEVAQRDSIPIYEIVSTFIDYFSAQLVRVGYSLPYKIRMRENLSEELRQYNQKGERTYFINREIKIRIKELLRQKAAEIVFHVLCHPCFTSCDKIHWMRVCASRCGRLKKKTRYDTIQLLANLLQKDVDKSLDLATLDKDPYQVIAHLTQCLTEILAREGYSTVFSNKEEVADALNIIFKKRIKEFNRKLNPSDEEIETPIPLEKLKLLRFVNRFQCSKFFTSYKKCYAQIRTFFRQESFETIDIILVPLREVGRMQELTDTNLFQRRIISREQIEIFMSALFTSQNVSLQLMQSFFEDRISLRERWETEQDPSRDDYQANSEANLRDIFLSDQEPWSNFLVNYLTFSKMQKELPSYINMEELPHLVHHTLVQTNKLPSNRIESVSLNLLHPKEEEAVIPKVLHEDEVELQRVEDALNERRILFSPEVRRFLEVTIKGSSLQEYFFTPNGKSLLCNIVLEDTHFYKTYLGFQKTLTEKLEETLRKDKVLSKLYLLSKGALTIYTSYEELLEQYPTFATQSMRAARLVSYSSKTLEGISFMRKWLEEELIKGGNSKSEEDEKEDEDRITISHGDSEKKALEDEIKLIKYLQNVQCADPIENAKRIEVLYEELILFTLGMAEEIHFVIDDEFLV